MPSRGIEDPRVLELYAEFLELDWVGERPPTSYQQKAIKAMLIAHAGSTGPSVMAASFALFTVRHGRTT